MRLAVLALWMYRLEKWGQWIVDFEMEFENIHIDSFNASNSSTIKEFRCLYVMKCAIRLMLLDSHLGSTLGRTPARYSRSVVDFLKFPIINARFSHTAFTAYTQRVI